MFVKSFSNLIIISFIIKSALSACLGTTPRYCLTDLADEDTNEKLNYVLSKYEEVGMQLTGTPVNVRGRQISYGDMQEFNINFRYVDNTEYDIIQYCSFVLLNRPGECESINTICNTFLPKPPRPLLEREPLTVCEDGVAKKTTATEAVEVDEQTTTNTSFVEV